MQGNQHQHTRWKMLPVVHSPYEPPENPLQSKPLPFSGSCLGWMAFPKEKASTATLPISCTQQGAHAVAQVPPWSIINTPSGSGGGSSTNSAAK